MGHLGPGQRPQHDPAVGLPGEVGVQRALGQARAVPLAEDQEHGVGGQPPAQVQQYPQGRLVQEVQVVHRDDHRGVPGQLQEEGADGRHQVVGGRADGPRAGRRVSVGQFNDFSERRCRRRRVGGHVTDGGQIEVVFFPHPRGGQQKRSGLVRVPRYLGE